MSNNKAQMNKRITTQLSHSRNSKKELGLLSRDLLTYVPETNDCPALIRLIEGQSPATKKICMQFFKQHVAWELDESSPQFGKKKKEKIVNSVKKKVDKLLEDPDFNLWTWYEAKGEKPEKKPTDFKKALTNNLVKGLKGEGENKLSTADIAAALFAADVSLRDLMQVAESYANIQAIEKAA